MMNSFDIDSYGVWVKTGPQDVTENKLDTNEEILDIADLPDFTFDVPSFDEITDNEPTQTNSLLDDLDIIEESALIEEHADDEDTAFPADDAFDIDFGDDDVLDDTDFPKEMIEDISSDYSEEPSSEENDLVVEQSETSTDSEDELDSFDVGDFEFDDISAFENDLNTVVENLDETEDTTESDTLPDSLPETTAIVNEDDIIDIEDTNEIAQTEVYTDDSFDISEPIVEFDATITENTDITPQENREDSDMVIAQIDDDTTTTKNPVDFKPEIKEPSAQSTAPTADTASFALLQQIAQELFAIKSEISDLKKEFEDLKESEHAHAHESIAETHNPPPNDISTGFFSDDDGDETIALSDDELSTILNTADFTEEKSLDKTDNNNLTIEEPIIEDIPSDESTETNMLTDASSLDGMDYQAILTHDDVLADEKNNLVEEDTLSDDELNNILNTADLTEEEEELIHEEQVYSAKEESFAESALIEEQDLPQISNEDFDLTITDSDTLSGDELSNILNSSDFTEEKTILESPESEEIDLTINDAINDTSFADTESSEDFFSHVSGLNFAEENLEEPILDDIDFGFADENEVEEELDLNDMLTPESILVESDGNAEVAEENLEEPILDDIDFSLADENEVEEELDLNDMPTPESILVESDGNAEVEENSLGDFDPSEFLDSSDAFPVEKSLDENNLAYLEEDENIDVDSVLEDTESLTLMEQLPPIEDIEINESDFDALARDLEIDMTTDIIEEDINLDIPFDIEENTLKEPVFEESLSEEIIQEEEPIIEESVNTLESLDVSDPLEIVEENAFETEEISLDAFDDLGNISDNSEEQEKEDDFSVEEESFTDSDMHIEYDDDEHISLESDDDDDISQTSDDTESFSMSDFDDIPVEEVNIPIPPATAYATDDTVFEESIEEMPITESVVPAIDEESEVVQEEESPVALETSNNDDAFEGTEAANPLIPPQSDCKPMVPPELKDEIKQVLRYMDQLLENLPEEKIEEFAKSEHFEVYKRLFAELGIV